MIRACIMLCSRCRKWTSYKSSKGGVKRIDTVCKVCGARIRHTHRPKPYTTFQNVKLRWGHIGSGGYQSWSSIRDLIIVDNPKYVHAMARFRNLEIQRRKGAAMGFDVDTLSTVEKVAIALEEE